jgi:chromosome segregation ATPase
MMLSKALKM